MEHKEDKRRNKGGRPKKGATDKMTYRVAVKMAAADYFRLLTRAHEAGVSPSGYMRKCFQNGHVKERLSKEHSDHVRKLCGMANNLNPACSQGECRRLSRYSLGLQGYGGKDS